MQQCILYGHLEQLQSIKHEGYIVEIIICGIKTTTTTTYKNVLKEFFLFLVIPAMLHGYKDLEEFGWDLLLKELADIKCAMYDQQVEFYYTV